MTAVRHDDSTLDPAEFIRQVLGRYDGRFLDCGDEIRRSMAAATREVLDAWLTDEIRARLPVEHRMRAFCVQHELIDELARLIGDECAGRRAGAVVVGGRVYAVYPYLRGVPRRHADITAEVGVEHRLIAVAWAGDALLIRGRATIERVAARDEHVEIVLHERTSGTERRIDAGPGPAEFAASVALAELSPGHWDVHVSVRALGLTRQAPLGMVSDPDIDVSALDRPEATAYFADDGRLVIAVPGAARRRSRAWWRRLAGFSR
jgi:hypothetical protein